MLYFLTLVEENGQELVQGRPLNVKGEFREFDGLDESPDIVEFFDIEDVKAAEEAHRFFRPDRKFLIEEFEL